MTGEFPHNLRDANIVDFGSDKKIKILLSTLKTGGVGLNLTMANKCILVDPWWNKAIQDQVSESILDCKKCVEHSVS
jgi:SNF2 family DNA or RNA helicase